MILYFTIIALGVILDIYTKNLALTVFKLNEITVIKNVFYLTYLENRGAAFGIFQNKQWFFIIFTVGVILFLTLYLIKIKFNNKLLVTALGLIVGGGMGNLIDRISKGYVVDFLDFRLINFPVFNVADCLVCIGVGLLFIYILFFDKEEK